MTQSLSHTPLRPHRGSFTADGVQRQSDRARLRSAQTGRLDGFIRLMKGGTRLLKAVMVVLQKGGPRLLKVVIVVSG